jgi:hypothetical protein
MQALAQVRSYATKSYLNSPYNTLLSRKITYCSLSAFAWSAGLGSSYILASSIAPITSVGLFLSSLAVCVLVNCYFIRNVSQENHMKKMFLVAISIFFYLGGAMTCTCFVGSMACASLTIKSIISLDLTVGLSALSWGTTVVGFALPAALKTNRMGFEILSEINTPLKHLPSWIEYSVPYFPARLRHIILANACLFIENEGFKSFLLRLEEYQITLQEIQSILKNQNKIQLFLDKCKALEEEANLIIAFCMKLKTRIKNVNSPEEAEDLMQQISRHSKSALDLIHLFNLLDNDLIHRLTEHYNLFLKNTHTNEHITFLKTQLKAKEEDDDETPSYEILGSLMTVSQCEKYIIQLNIPMKEGGSIYTFQKELEKNNLGTLGQLKEAKLYPLQETHEAQETLLLQTLLKNRPAKQSYILRQSMSDTLKKILFLMKRIFIEGTFWSLRLLSLTSNPWLFSSGLIYGLIFTDQTSRATALYVPDSESILYTEDTFQGARSFRFGILLNGMRGMSGFLTASAILRLQRIARRTIRSF